MSILISPWIAVPAGLAAASMPALYVWKHFAYSPNRRDITLPADDLSWRTTSNLAVSLTVLGMIAALAIYFVIPAEVTAAHSADIGTVVCSVLTALAFGKVVRGLLAGRTDLFLTRRSVYFERKIRPLGFWASTTLNSLFGLIFLLMALSSWWERPAQTPDDQCQEAGMIQPAQGPTAGCTP